MMSAYAHAMQVQNASLTPRNIYVRILTDMNKYTFDPTMNTSERVS
jgi:hypothetical protein